MIGLIQRVRQAHVEVDNQTIARIEQGILAFIGIEKPDSEQTAGRLLKKMMHYRIFADNEDRMNLSLSDINGDLLLVPQFTLLADTKKGTRPGFSKAAPPDRGRRLFAYLLEHARQSYRNVYSGGFGATMQVSLTNDGPATFWLQV